MTFRFPAVKTGERETGKRMYWDSEGGGGDICQKGKASQNGGDKKNRKESHKNGLGKGVA